MNTNNLIKRLLKSLFILLQYVIGWTIGIIIAAMALLLPNPFPIIIAAILIIILFIQIFRDTK